MFKGQKYWIDVDGAAGATGTATLQWVMPDAPPLPGSWTGPAPVAGANSLTSVSCGSIARCTAVDFAGNAFVYDGRRWSAPATADPAGSLTSVSCIGSRCVAVASNGDAVSLLGSRWSAPVRADPAGGFLSVSCSGANFCAAVDFFGNVATYNGTSWSSPVSIDSNPLTSISCSAIGQCVAVDLEGRAITLRSGTWSAPVDVGAGELTSVSCPTSTFCAAVGDGGLGATFDGQSWSAPTDLGAGPLTSVSCPTATFCAAVGTTGSGTTFDGQTWSPPAAADPGGGVVVVSCATPRRCEAVDASSFTTYVGVLGGAIVLAPRNVIGNTDIRIRGTAWDLDEDMSVTIYECATPNFSAATCATANAETVPSIRVAGSGFTRLRAIAGPIDGGGDTCGLVGSPPCSIVVVGNLGDVTSAPSRSRRRCSPFRRRTSVRTRR